MTRDDIIRMAREAEIGDSHGHMIRNELPKLERFAALVAQRVLAGSYPEMIALVAAAAKAEEREHGQKWFDAVTAQHKQEILAEREACLNCYSPDDTATDWADKIRARGETE